MVLGKSFRYTIIFVTLGACVDPISFDTGRLEDMPLVIDGHVTDLPGPYTVRVSSSFDIDAKVSTRIAQEVKRIILTDNAGTKEELIPQGDGLYKTVHMQGTVGRVYTLQVELYSGRVYESIPDTLLHAGALDSVYYNLNETGNGLYANASGWGFDILANASSGDANTSAFLWTTKGTFQVDTQPALINTAKSKCYRQTPDNGQCSFIPPCSGLYNVGTTRFPSYATVGPCTCCTCWYDLFNNRLALSDNSFRATASVFKGVNVFRVPVSPLLLMHKMYIDVTMFTLSRQSYQFWKVIKNQQEAVGSIFQPITGKITSQFRQVSGTPVAVTGIFYAAGARIKTIEITRSMVNPISLFSAIPQDGTYLSCFDLYPNATNVKPDFWVD
ncbi:MAG TPA: DUF4249 family protein [Cyclobacteriaceae bacterium]|nr:DUF4249 family protein [Cyclobacteriaceae bacterium]